MLDKSTDSRANGPEGYWYWRVVARLAIADDDDGSAFRIKVFELHSNWSDGRCVCDGRANVLEEVPTTESGESLMSLVEKDISLSTACLGRLHLDDITGAEEGRHEPEKSTSPNFELNG